MAAQRASTVRELLHALGFNADSWALFRYPDGTTPRTDRDINDGVPLTSTVCADGTTGYFRVPSESTLTTGTRRGASVNLLVTPKVRSVSRDIFGCGDLLGAELDQPSVTSCWGSRWEPRLMANELMATTSTTRATVYSALTLAALEDSGW